jgi:hypothetical protein
MIPSRDNVDRKVSEERPKIKKNDEGRRRGNNFPASKKLAGGV